MHSRNKPKALVMDYSNLDDVCLVFRIGCDSRLIAVGNLGPLGVGRASAITHSFTRESDTGHAAITDGRLLKT